MTAIRLRGFAAFALLALTLGTVAAQPTAEGIIDEFLQARLILAAQALKLYRYVVVDGQCGSHANSDSG